MKASTSVFRTVVPGRRAGARKERVTEFVSTQRLIVARATLGVSPQGMARSVVRVDARKARHPLEPRPLV
jgi:hypothetical protein